MNKSYCGRSWKWVSSSEWAPRKAWNKAVCNMTSPILVRPAYLFQCSRFSWRAVKISRCFKRTEDLRGFKSISVAPVEWLNVMLSWPIKAHFDWLRETFWCTNLSTCIFFATEYIFSRMYSAQSELKAAFDSKTKCFESDALAEMGGKKRKKALFHLFPLPVQLFSSVKNLI